uniref:Uncharacterized protein n=1 Tax=Sphaerodactylus townsendi TaxID=933632 RepID=A0ACB8EFU7_9SAUR
MSTLEPPSLEGPSCPSFGYLEKATSNSLLKIFSSHQQHQLENIVSQEFLPLKSPVKVSPGSQTPKLTGVKWRHSSPPSIPQLSPTFHFIMNNRLVVKESSE